MNVIGCEIWDKTSFCPNVGGLSINAISEMINESLFDEAKDSDVEKILLARYKQMIKNFKEVHYNDRVWNLTGFQGCICTATPSKPDARLKVPQNYFTNHSEWFGYSNFGHDMPIWFCKGNADGAFRIMFVSVDPKRVGDAAGALYLGTPFGFHSCDYRCHTRTDLINLLITNLINDGAMVYLTDINKLYGTEMVGNKSVKVDFKDERANKYPRIIEKEIALFSPDLIVTLGNDPVNVKCCRSSLNSIVPMKDGFGVQRNAVHKSIDAIAAYHPNPSHLRESYPSNAAVRPYNTLAEYYDGLYDEIGRRMRQG